MLNGTDCVSNDDVGSGTGNTGANEAWVVAYVRIRFNSVNRKKKVAARDMFALLCLS